MTGDGLERRVERFEGEVRAEFRAVNDRIDNRRDELREAVSHLATRDELRQGLSGLRDELRRHMDVVAERLETRFTQVADALMSPRDKDTRLEQRVDGLDARVDSVELRVTAIERRER